jgi:hypothetical protein
MKKPPAFQFYAKDWRSSSTIRCMRLAQRGVAIESLAASWDQDEPGTLPIPEENAAKVCGIPVEIFKTFRRNFPKFWQEQDGKLVNLKLRAQWEELEQIKRAQSNAAKNTNEKLGRWPSHSDTVSDPLTEALGDPSASAPASAPAKSKPNPPIVPPCRGDEKPSYLDFGGQWIEIFMGNRTRLFSRNEWSALSGARASDVVSRLRGRGFMARIVPEDEVATWKKAETAGATP